MKTDFGVLGEMGAIGLDEMDAIRLMDRIDTKYLTDLETLETVLRKACAAGYRVFEISGKKIQYYSSMYYDTPLLQMYLDHHNRRLVRQKVRVRRYESSGQTFLELKSKNNHGRTKKKRMEIDPELYSSLLGGEGLSRSASSGSCASAGRTREAQKWLAERLNYNVGCLTPSLETVFSRITMVNPEKTERSTIDFNLKFCNVRKGTEAGMGDLVVIEVKQDGNVPSHLRDILLECRVKPVRISKYCIGTALTDDSVKSGRFKGKLMLINKMKTQI